jgi:hypothetical protein
MLIYGIKVSQLHFLFVIVKNNIIKVVRKAKKGRLLNSLERYHTFRISKDQIHMNDINVEQNNPVFKIIYQNIPNR